MLNYLNKIKYMKTTEQLINNVIGQLQGINRMIDDEKDCFQVIVQMKAAKAGLNAVLQKYLEKNLDTCMKKNTKTKEQEKIKKLLTQVVKNN